MRIQLWKARGIPAYLICKVDEETGTYQTDEENSRLIQTDWDYPSVASAFGFSLSDVQSAPLPRHWQTGKSFRCPHDSTDGTVGCDSCSLTASDFINEARKYLDEHLGAIAEDPGYFE